MILASLFGVLALAAGARYLRRRRGWTSRGRGISDDMIRQIERRGTLEVDEGLDLKRIREEEERFWDEERWDRADPL